MINKLNIFKILGALLVLLLAILLTINIIYIKTTCLTRECFIVNLSTILLVVWAISFLFLVLRYSKKDKK